MSALRKAFFWLHLSAGLAAGLVILVMSLTGALLAFEPQILRRAERAVRAVSPAPGASRLPAGALVAAAESGQPDARVTALTVSADPQESASVAFGREKTIFVDPYTGQVLGEGSRAVRGFFRTVTDWHRWLATSETRRATGRAVTGAANLAFFGLALSGVYLWWPRKWTARLVRNVTLFQGGLSGRARDFNWHNVVGFWSSAVLLVLTTTGMVLSYRWANNLLYTLTGSELPPAPASAPPGARPPGRGAPDRAPEAPRLDYDRLVAAAQAQAPDWQSITLRVPQGKGPVTFTIDRDESWNPYARSQLALDPSSAAVVRWEPYTAANAGRKLRVWARGLHTGEPGGVPGQAAAGLASLGGAALVWTGFAMAWRRWRAWRAASRAEKTAAVAAPAERAAG